MNDFPTLATLEELLTGVRERAAESGHQAIADEMAEALKLAASARGVLATTRLQIQGALLSLRSGCPDDAIEYLERALVIGERWANTLLHEGN